MAAVEKAMHRQVLLVMTVLVIVVMVIVEETAEAAEAEAEAEAEETEAAEEAEVVTAKRVAAWSVSTPWAASLRWLKAVCLVWAATLMVADCSVVPVMACRIPSLRTLVVIGSLPNWQTVSSWFRPALFPNWATAQQKQGHASSTR
jgi:hypothetical protein